MKTNKLVTFDGQINYISLLFNLIFLFQKLIYSLNYHNKQSLLPQPTQQIIMSRLFIFALLLILQPCLSQQPSDLENLRFSGTYTNKGLHPLFNYLDLESGNFDIYFEREQEARQQGDVVGIAVLELLNPKYHDQKVVDIKVNLKGYDLQKHQWLNDSAYMQVYTFYKENKNSQSKKLFYTATCEGYFSISFKNHEGPWNSKTETVQIEFVGRGDNHCQFAFTAEGNYVDEKYKILAYCGFISGILLIQIACAFKLMNQLTSNEINADKLSLLTISIITIQDFYLTMMHMYFLMTESRFYQYFILPIFLLVIMSIIFDMRLLFIVWRIKYISEINNGQLRKKITIFYVQFYLGMFGYLMLMFFFTYEIWPLYVQSFLFLPQIIHNVRKGNNPQFYYYFILGVLGMRVVLPIYYRGCPDNIYMIQPDTTFCIVWSTLFGIQILTLFIQKLFGPRFFIPKKFIPGHYEYMKKLEYVPGMENPECNICIQSIFPEEQIVVNTSVNDGSNSSLHSEFIKKKKVTVMKTPCNHIFHPECLKHWIDVKLECPSCRLGLPPVQ